MQVLLYAGAIMVLFVFVIMLLSLRKEELGHEHGGARKGFAAVAAVLVFLLLASPAWTYPGREGGGNAPQPRPDSRFGTAEQFGATETFVALYDDGLVAFELVSVLLLSALAGVVILARKKFPPPAGPVVPVEKHDHSVVPEHHPPSGPLVGAGGHK
jgi:NADH-quinone oxidoreductase subunit J